MWNQGAREVNAHSAGLRTCEAHGGGQAAVPVWLWDTCAAGELQVQGS